MKRFWCWLPSLFPKSVAAYTIVVVLFFRPVLALPSVSEFAGGPEVEGAVFSVGDTLQRMVVSGRLDQKRNQNQLCPRRSKTDKTKEREPFCSCLDMKSRLLSSCPRLRAPPIQ